MISSRFLQLNWITLFVVRRFYSERFRNVVLYPYRVSMWVSANWMALHTAHHTHEHRARTQYTYTYAYRGMYDSTTVRRFGNVVLVVLSPLYSFPFVSQRHSLDFRFLFSIVNIKMFVQFNTIFMQYNPISIKIRPIVINDGAINPMVCPVKRNNCFSEKIAKNKINFTNCANCFGNYNRSECWLSETFHLFFA